MEVWSLASSSCCELTVLEKDLGGCEWNEPLPQKTKDQATTVRAGCLVDISGE